VRREDREFVAQLCTARAGLNVDPEKSYLLESRLAPVARREGFGSVGDMLAALRERRDDQLAWGLVEAMAQGETAFFRDRRPFELFGEEMLPRLARLRRGAPVRVWSAGCATGQEAYSLAMTVAEARAAGETAPVELFGSDLSERALARARAGLYSHFEVQRGLPIRKLVEHFVRDGEMWALAPEVRSMVQWRRINLVAELTLADRFDVIFCRNVLGLLTEAMQVRLLDNLSRALALHGVLVLGQEERVTTLVRTLVPVSGRPGVYVRDPAARVAAA
jgi:chemotaxis protein methyltransferase CheR